MLNKWLVSVACDENTFVYVKARFWAMEEFN